MIRDHLIRELKQRFPDSAFVLGEPPKPVASLQSPCQALGQMDICDDGDEATVYFTATHGHFSCYDETLSVEQREQQIADDVITFLDSLFKDRVVIWQVLWRTGRRMASVAAGRGYANTLNGTPSVCLDERDNLTQPPAAVDGPSSSSLGPTRACIWRVFLIKYLFGSPKDVMAKTILARISARKETPR